jgi:hypothetical protein
MSALLRSSQFGASSTRSAPLRPNGGGEVQVYYGAAPPRG